MADRNSPPPPRPHNEDSQPQPAAEGFGNDRSAYAEDPLVELARIVGETGRIDPDFQAPPPPPAARPNLNEDLAGGLEAELMAELRPSYPDEAAQVQNFAPVEPGAYPVAPQPEVYSSTQGHAQDYPVQPEAPYAPDVSHVEAPQAEAAPQTHRSVFPQGPGFGFGRDTAFRNLGQSEQSSENPYDSREPEIGYPGEADRGPVSGPDFGFGLPQQPSSYVEPQGEPYNPAQSVFVPQQPEAPDVDDMSWPAAESAISDTPDSFDELNASQDTDAANAEFDDIFEPETEYAPGVSPEHVLPPHSEAERHMAPEVSGSKRGLLVAGTVAAVVLVGGFAFLLNGLFSDGGPSGPVEVVRADEAPFKVYPTEQRPETAVPSKAIYDRVGGVAAPRKEQLVPREEAPVAAVPTTTGSQPRRVTGEQVDEAPRASEPVTANGLPRRVRTVVVRPDGTIINAPTETADNQPSAVVATEPVRTTTIRVPSDNASVPAASAADQIAAAPVADVPTPSGVAGTDTGVVLAPRPKPEVPQEQLFAAAPAVDTVGSQPLPRSGPLDISGSQGQTATPQPPASVAPAAQPTRTASAESGSIPSGTYVVQISSQRSREQAQSSYTAMQRRYPSVLGNVPSVIQAADLGDKGVYYRVRIVSESRDAATRLCENLKAAGGDCFVRRTE